MKVFKVHLRGKSKALRIDGDSAQRIKAAGVLIIRQGQRTVAEFLLSDIQGWNEEAAEKSEPRQNAVRSKTATTKERSLTTKTRKTAKNSGKWIHAASAHTPSIGAAKRSGEAKRSGQFSVHPRTPFPPLTKRPKPKS